MYYAKRGVKEDYSKLKQSTAALSIMTNTLLVVLKLAVGFFTGAVSVISEAAHSAVDLLASLVAYLAVKKSAKPPDGKHAYGHGKIENLSAAFEAFLIIVAACWIAYEAAEKLINPVKPDFLEYGIAVMIISIGVNYWVSEKLYKTAVLTNSQALEADALHLRADVWTSAGVLIGLLLIKTTGYYWIDPAIAIVIAVIILKTGYTMTKKNIYQLTDISLSAQEEKIIYEIVESQPEVISFHQLRTRSSGSNKMIDMHIILKKDMPLYLAHAICDRIEIKITEYLGNCDVMIHLEPCDNYHDDFGECPNPCPGKKKDIENGAKDDGGKTF